MRPFEKSAQAYAETYKPGTELLIKISGAEIDGPAFPQFVDHLRTLRREGLRLIVVAGAGEQIGRRYAERFGVEREKLGGKGRTDERVLLAAQDAARDIERKFSAGLEEDVRFAHPKDVPCDFDRAELGLVGIPREIALDTRASLSVIGSLGTVGTQLVNVNADDIALQIASQHPSIYEAFFLTQKGGIEDANGRIVSIADEDDLQRMLDGAQERVTLTGGMRLKVENIRAMIEKIGKVAITNIDGLMREITTWEGGGTLCHARDALGASRIRPAEHDLFRSIFDEHVRAGDFRARTPSEFEELIACAYATRVKRAPIGFFALKKHGDGWHELSAISKLMNGVGTRLVESAKRLTRESAPQSATPPLFALSREGLIDFFTRCGFTHRGTVEQLRHRFDIPLPEFARTYATPGRNPHVFTLTA